MSLPEDTNGTPKQEVENPSSGDSTPTMKSVFSTTSKVFISLLVISAVIGIGYLVIAVGPSVAADQANRDRNRDTEQYLQHLNEQEADNAHSKVPASRWKASVASSIKKHYPQTGMTRDEVKAAMQPQIPLTQENVGTSPYYSDNTHLYYERTSPTKDCLSYSGEKCAQYSKIKKYSYCSFSPNGFLEKCESGQETIQ